jgi:hypothetical protein
MAPILSSRIKTSFFPKGCGAKTNPFWIKVIIFSSILKKSRRKLIKRFLELKYHDLFLFSSKAQPFACDELSFFDCFIKFA